MDNWLNDPDLTRLSLDEDETDPFDYNLTKNDLEIILEDYARKIS